MSKKDLPISLTNEQWLNIDYAIVKFMQKEEPTAISEQQEPLDFPNYHITFMTVKATKQAGIPYPQIWFHIRIKDKRTNEIIDLDAYAPAKEIRKTLELAEEMKLSGIKFKAKPPTTATAKQRTTTIRYFYKENLARTTRRKNKE